MRKSNKLFVLTAMLFLLTIFTSCSSDKGISVDTSEIDSKKLIHTSDIITAEISVSSTDTTDESVPISLSDTEIQFTEFPQNIVGTTIPLIKIEYECPNPTTFDDSIWELQSDKSYENVLGTDIQVLYYETDAFTEQNRCTVIIDTKTNLLLYLSYDFHYYNFQYIDINGDGTREILYESISSSAAYVFEMQDSTLYQIDLAKSTYTYLDQFSVTPRRIDFWFQLNHIEDLNKIRCIEYFDDGICYQDTDLYITWSIDALQIQDEKTYYYHRYQPFTSNDPLYSTEVVYDAPRDDTPQEPYSNNMLIVHIGDVCYSYDMVYQLYYNDRMDISYPRKLIVHPTLPYFALVYPIHRQCANDPQGLTFVIISSETGEIIDNSQIIHNQNEAIYQNEAVRSATEEVNREDVTINRTICVLSPTDTGFHYVVSVEDTDGNVLFDCIYETDIILT